MPLEQKGVAMKKYILMTSKIVITAFFIISGLVVLTDWRLYGIHLFGIYVPPEQVNMFVDSSGTYLYIVYITLVILIIWGVWIGRRVIKK